jgi:hypothetical protein
VRATTLAKLLKFWAAALILAVALAASRGAFAATEGRPAPAPAAPAVHSSGPALRADPASCGGELSLPTPPMLGEAGDDVKTLSSATQSYIRDCGCATQACVADALEKYADALTQVAPHLPPQLQDAPAVVAQAAQRVRSARTKAEATRALREAIAIIHKDIELVRAEDPDNPRATRGGDFVAETLNVASLALEKGGGL